MDIEVADWSQILSVLRQTHAIWSSGLDKSRYYHYIWWQLQQSWSRRNYSYLVGCENRQIVTSCKLYRLDFLLRGSYYRLGGLGAIYTPPHLRGQGFASRFLKKMRRYCLERGFDGLLLHSDIDPDFYGRAGFQSLGSHDFYILLDDGHIESSILADSGSVQDRQSQPGLPVSLGPWHLEALELHHRRWLPARPYGLVRSPEYWSYKIARENYVARHARAQWPGLELIEIDLGLPSGGYAILERGRQIARVLEVVGGDAVRQALWRHIFRLSLSAGDRLLRGWEGAAPDFLSGVKYVGRDWGSPMLLPLNRDLDCLADVVACPLLELDHF